MHLDSNPENFKVDKVHRLGPPPTLPKGRFQEMDSRNIRPRPILVAFNWLADRERVWRQKSTLKDSGHHLEEDQPLEIEARRSRLLPVYKKAMTIQEYKRRTFLNGDRLTINGTHYTIENLHELPDDLDPRLIATKTQGNTTIFFGQNSPLSNHHPSPMIVDNIDYRCNEQYYFAMRAQQMGDDRIHYRVMAALDPKVMLREGRKAENKLGIKVEDAEKKIMTRGVREKFDQNPALREFLLGTANTRIGESAASNKKWGTGFHLGHKDAFNTDLWADNMLGETIQEQRDRYNNK
jgi:hypothetical protein